MCGFGFGFRVFDFGVWGLGRVWGTGFEVRGLESVV